MAKVLWAVAALVLASAVGAQEEDRCVGVPDFGFIRNEFYCYRFYQCVDGFPYPLICNGDTWFDEEQQRCDLKENVVCEVEDNPPAVTPTPGICTGVEDNRLVLHPLFCNQYYLCVGQIGFPVVCPAGLWFNQEMQTCANPAEVSCPHGPPGAARCRDEPDFTLVASSAACYMYYQCVSGYPYPMMCRDGEFFDAERHICDDQDNVECDITGGPPIVPTPGICNNRPNNGLAPNPIACNKYYVCIDEIGWSKYCPLNLWFDEEEQTCTQPGRTNCTLGPEIPPEREPGSCDGIANLGYIRNEFFCYRYFQCRNGYAFPLICPANQWFDVDRQVCDDFQNVDCEVDENPPTITPTPGVCNGIADGLVLHPIHCNQYYICQDEIGIPVICPSGLWFDSESETCRPALQVDCPHGLTPPPPDPFDMCIGVEDFGYVRNPNFCYRYFQCVSGTPYPLICEGDLVFDEERQLCDELIHVECNVVPPPVIRPPPTQGICIGSPNGRLEANPVYCNQYYICISNAGWRLVCPPGLWFDEELQTCSPAGSIECDLAPERPVTENPYRQCSGVPNNAYVRDDSFCYRYYKCVNGSPYPMICSGDLWFDERLQQCRSQDLVECEVTDPPPRPPATAGICNGISNSVQVPHPFTCNQFYICVDQIGFPQVCPTAMWFDRALQTCLPVTETSCPLGPPTTTTVAPHPWGMCELVPNYSYVSNPNYCYRFFQCIDERPYPMICPSNQWFDEERQICADQDEVRCIFDPEPPFVPSTPGICNDASDGELILNPRACNQYYICVGQIGYPLLCPTGLWFDAQHQRCDRPSNVYCPLVPEVTTPNPLDACDDIPEGGMFRNDFFCYRYYQCVDSLPYPMICRSGLWFDQERQLCDRPDNVQCFLRPGQPGPPIATPEICTGVANGVFTRNWLSCNQYYLCVNQIGYSQICPDGLWYDDYRQICDHPENVQCPLSPTTLPPNPWGRCDGVEDMSLVPDDNFCYAFFQCINGAPYPMICPNDQWFDFERQRCDSPDVVECVIEGPLPSPSPTPNICDGLTNSVQVLHPTFCNRFYICVDQVGFPQVCPTGLWFDEARQTCDSPLEVDCPNAPTTTPSPIEGICNDVPPGTYVPNPLDCSRYYVCVNNYPYSLECPVGQWFDSVLLACVPANEAECADTVTTVPTPGVCNGIEDDVRVPSPTSCTFFYICLGEVGMPASCPPGLWFNEPLQDCDDPANVDCDVEQTSPPTGSGICEGQPDGRYVASPYSCSQYYVCSNQNGYPVICQPGLWFSEAAQMCDDPANVDCNIP